MGRCENAYQTGTSVLHLVSVSLCTVCHTCVGKSLLLDIVHNLVKGSDPLKREMFEYYKLQHWWKVEGELKILNAELFLCGGGVCVWIFYFFLNLVENPFLELIYVTK